jgi:metal-responsive CopG/Arc/MetJ family transcriptional regulator
MRLSISVDRDLLEEARLLGGTRTKSEVIEQALREFVQRRRLASLIALEGSDIVDMDPRDIQEWRRSTASRG